RGYAPAPLPLPVPAPELVLAVGAQLKHTATLAVGGQAVVGPHTGDLADEASYEAFESTVDRLCRWQGVTPAVVAHDLHPRYLFGGEDLGGPRPGPDSFPSRLDPREVAVVHRMVRRGVNAPLASSAGRLFDAVASLLGLCDEATYEGEAAVLLEAAASGHGPTP